MVAEGLQRCIDLFTVFCLVSWAGQGLLAHLGWILATTLQPPEVQHLTMLLLTGLSSCAAWLEELSGVVSMHRVTLKTVFIFLS